MRNTCSTFCACVSFSLRAQTNNPNKVDDDGNRLVEIWSLTELDNMRYNLSGTSYRDAALDQGQTLVSRPGDTRDCPDEDHDNDATPDQSTCHGYELMTDLDFRDKNTEGYGSAWISTSSGREPIGDGSDVSRDGWQLDAS